MPFDKPAPDLAKILVAWQKWEKGEEQPGRTLASLKTAGLDAVLTTLRVTKRSGRNGDSWLNRIPEQANRSTKASHNK